MPTKEQKRRYNATPAAKASRAQYGKTMARTEAGRASRAGYTLRWRTGWTPEARDLARQSQLGRCAICPREGDDLCCDHTERDGVKVPRALLCQACNLGLGYYERWQRPVGLVIEPYEDYLAAH